MGTDLCFVVGSSARGGSVGLQDWEEVEAVGGWSILKPIRGDPLPYWIYPRELEEAGMQVAKAGGVALAVFVENSDVAYAVACTDAGVVARLLFGVEAARDYTEGREALDLLSDEFSTQPEAFEAWSRLAGTPVSAERIREMLGQNWLFKEEAIFKLIKELRIPVSLERL